VSVIAPAIGLSSPAYQYENTDYGLLLTDPFADNPFWTDLTTAMNGYMDGLVHYPTDELYNLREDTANPLTVAYNTRMLGFNVPLNSFSVDQYINLFQSLGTYRMTSGATIAFLDFLAYIEETQFIFIPLWGNSLSENVSDLTDTPGVPVWEGGDYFMTPYYDLEYNYNDFPNLDVNAFLQILYEIAPIYLVCRSIAFIETYDAIGYTTPTGFVSSTVSGKASYPYQG
jgi:hypothetical protein